MRRITSTLATAAAAVFLTGGAASAALIADYRLDDPANRGDSEIPEIGEVLDSQGPLFSNAVSRKTFPTWIEVMPEGLPAVPNNPSSGVPSDGVALQLGQSQGFDFGQGAGNELSTALQQGGFTVFSRVLKTAPGQTRLLRKEGTMVLQFDNHGTDLVLGGYVVLGGTTFSAKATITDDLNQWIDVAMVFDPGASVQLYVDGALSASAAVPDTAIGSNANPVYFEHVPTGFAYMESLRIYDHAMSATEVASLSAVPEPAMLGLVAPAVMLLSRRRRK